MITQTLNYIGIALITISLWQSILIAAAIIRNKNTYTIMHISCINDSLTIITGLLGIAIIMLANNLTHEGLKVLFLCALIYICNPITSYVLSKIAYFYKNTPLDESRKRRKRVK